MFLMKVGSYAPHTPTPLRGFVWRRDNAAWAETLGCGGIIPPLFWGILRLSS